MLYILNMYIPVKYKFIY